MIAAEIEPAEAGGRRRSPRAPVSFDAGLGRGGLDRALCKVVDLSMHGVRLQTYSALRQGTLIWLTLPKVGSRAVRVMRADDFTAGCEFLEPLPQVDFDTLVAIDATLDRNA
ncbi:MAG: PilZ domain-containing protein [Pseudomonadota bacterium]